MHAIAVLSEQVVYLPQLGSLSLEMPPLDILVGAIDLLYEGVKLFLLLAQGGFTSEDACLALALVLLLLVWGLPVLPAIVVSRWCFHKAGPL